MKLVNALIAAHTDYKDSMSDPDDTSTAGTAATKALIAAYDEAVKAGLTKAETSGTTYDLLNNNTTPAADAYNTAWTAAAGLAPVPATGKLELKDGTFESVKLEESDEEGIDYTVTLPFGSKVPETEEEVKALIQIGNGSPRARAVEEPDVSYVNKGDGVWEITIKGTRGGADLVITVAFKVVKTPTAEGETRYGAAYEAAGVSVDVDAEKMSVTVNVVSKTMNDFVTDTTGKYDDFLAQMIGTQQPNAVWAGFRISVPAGTATIERTRNGNSTSDNTPTDEGYFYEWINVTKPRTGEEGSYKYPILDNGTTKIGPITYTFKDASGGVISTQTWDVERVVS